MLHDFQTVKFVRESVGMKVYKCINNVMPPSAIAGNRVNRECYMQVRGYGCTTPALVPFCVARL